MYNRICTIYTFQVFSCLSTSSTGTSTPQRPIRPSFDFIHLCGVPPHIVRAYKRVASAGAFTPDCAWSSLHSSATIPRSSSTQKHAAQTAARVTSSKTHVLTPYHVLSRNMAASTTLPRVSGVIATYLDPVQTPVFDVHTAETVHPHRPCNGSSRATDAHSTSPASSRSSSPSSNSSVIQVEERRGSYSCVKEDDCGTPCFVHPRPLG